MSVQHIRSREGRTKIGIETPGSFGTASGSMVDIFPTGTVKMDLFQEEIPIKDQSALRGDHKGTVKGRKSGKASFPLYLKCAQNQLVALASPATPPHAKLLKAILGGEAAAAGSTIASASAADTITVQTGDGGNFPKGTACAVEMGAGQPQAALIINQTGDVLTLYPPLTAIPSVGAKVINSYTYYQTETNSASLTLQHARAASSQFQYELRGGTGSLDFKSDRDSLMSMVANLQFADWSDGALGQPTGWVADSQHNPIPLVSGFTLLQPISTLTRTQYPFHSVEGKLEASMSIIPQLAGGVQQTIGTFRGSADQTATVELMTPVDRTLLDTWWATQEQLFCMFGSFDGSGATARGIVFTFPSLIIVGKPAEDESTGRLLSKVSCVAQLIDQTASTEIARSAARVSLF